MLRESLAARSVSPLTVMVPLPLASRPVVGSACAVAQLSGSGTAVPRVTCSEKAPALLAE